MSVEPVELSVSRLLQGRAKPGSMSDALLLQAIRDNDCNEIAYLVEEDNANVLQRAPRTRGPQRARPTDTHARFDNR